jgi:hypothetical protein
MDSVRFAIVCSLLAACAPQLHQEPRQAEALQTVWEAYGQEKTPPDIIWQQDCLGPHGEPGVRDGGVCVGGMFEGWVITLPWTGSYSSSAFAHELLHAKQALQGVYDSGHTLPEWQTLLPLANQRLEEKGL